LDPDVDCLRMVQLVVGRLFGDPVFMSLLFTVAYWRQVAIPPIARILERRGTGDTITATGKRVDDTLAFFGFMYRDGWCGERAEATIDRVAAIHEQFPDIRADDFRYTLATLCFEPVRIPEILGVPGLTSTEARALYVFWCHVGRRMGVTVTEDQHDLRSWMEAYEVREYAFTPEAARLAAAVGQACVQRYFPSQVQYLGWGMLRSMSDPRLLQAVGQPAPAGPMRRFTTAFARAYLAGRRVLPAPDCDRLVAPWTKAYGPNPTPEDIGPAWAAGITGQSRRHDS
jgi:hypothetical protein